jgi:hypothetical protein
VNANLIHRRLARRGASLPRQLPYDLPLPSKPLPRFLAAPLWCIRAREPKKARQVLQKRIHADTMMTSYDTL